MDLSIWSALHDGSIVRILGPVPGDVQLWISIEYLLPYLPLPASDANEPLVLTLHSCTVLEYTPLGGVPVQAFDVLMARPPEILSAQLQGDLLLVYCMDAFWGGQLALRYVRASVRSGGGTQFPLHALPAAAAAYWNAWQARQVEARRKT